MKQINKHLLGIYCFALPVEATLSGWGTSVPGGPQPGGGGGTTLRTDSEARRSPMNGSIVEASPVSLDAETGAGTGPILPRGGEYDLPVLGVAG